MIDYERLAQLYVDGKHVQIQRELDTQVFYGVYDGYVQPKERPRITKGGRTYTPEKTRKFESQVRKWGVGIIKSPVRYPIRVQLTVRIGTSSEEEVYHGMANLTAPRNNDLDNLEKSILDGLNQVLYLDDRQVAEVHKKKIYAADDGFTLVAFRCGLSPLEYANFNKCVANLRKNQ